MPELSAVRRGAPALWLLAGVWLLIPACGTGEEDGEGQGPASTTADTEEGVFQPERRTAAEPPLPPLITDVGLGDRFAHQPHRSVDCRTCHASVPGHGSHATLECGECHPAPPTNGPSRVVPEAECLRCHHLEQGGRECGSCHGSGPDTTLQVQTAMRVAGTVPATSRILPFPHDEHQSRPCATCHSSTPRQGVEEGCAGCHQDHHRVASDCATCHFPSPLELHDASAHRGCAGSDCHTAAVETIPPSRARCLSCHTDQGDHEVGNSCASCHLWEGGPRPSDDVLLRPGRPR